MLIRISQNSEGIEHYFETGQKQGREHTRDILDHRVHLMGSLDAFSTAVVYTNKHKKWKEHYWHLSAGFALENSDLDDDTLRAITREMLAYYYPTHRPDDLIVAAEAHRPRIQSEIDKTTGKVHQRLLHLHIAVSKWDPVTDNQVRMIPFKLEADRAFQSYLAKKYNLIDPANRKRSEPFTKADIISRWRKDNKPVTKQAQVAELRKIFSELLVNVTSIDQAIVLLKALDFVGAVDYKKQTSGNRYLQVSTTLGSRNINLRGQGFEALEALYYSGEELAARKSIGKYKEPAQLDNKSIIVQHRKWWLEQQAKRKAKAIDYSVTQTKYQKRFIPQLKEARTYYVLYGNNIEEKLIHGFRLWEKNNTRYLFNNYLGVKIYDRPNRIMAEIPDDPMKRRAVVALMLQMAQAKGWDINALTITGSDAFKYEVLEQIERINKEKALTATVAAAAVRNPIPEPVKTKPRLNVVGQAVHDNRQRQLEKLSSEQIAAIKRELHASAVIDYAVSHWGLMGDHFSVTMGNKIVDSRTKAKPKNVIDFLTKTCNVPLSEAMPLLNGMLAQQQRAAPPVVGPAQEAIARDETTRITPDEWIDPPAGVAENPEAEEDDDDGLGLS